MSENVQILSIGIIVITALIAVFYSGKVLLARWKKLSVKSKRVLIEDALKHLYDCEYNGLLCTINSIAGNLSINADESAKLVQKLESMGLVASKVNGIELTGEGRTYALKVIRIHRLWESYLADETGLTEKDWHHDAEKKEHILSEDEAENLAAKIGNPLTDPHGDPIPTSRGEMPGRKGIPISDIKIGDFAKIIHLEDEPSAIYSQLVAEGLHVGQVIQVTVANNERIKFETDGEEIILAPIFANNITVERISKKEFSQKPFRTLSELAIGEEGKVIGISKACRGQQRRRLLDLGVVPGTVIIPEIKSVGGDPTGYKIRGATIALRKNQSDKILIEDTAEEG